MSSTITDVDIGYQGPSGPPGIPVRLATAAALPAYTASATGLIANANGALTIDGTAVAAGDDILVQSEGSGTSAVNRVCTVAVAGDGSNPWRLAFKAGVAYRVGQVVSIGKGDTYGKKFRMLTTDVPITVGVTSLTWEATS